MRSIARENPELQGAIDIVDFNATAAGQRIITDDTIKLLVGVLGKYRLGISDVEPDIIGRAYSPAPEVRGRFGAKCRGILYSS